MAEQTYRSKRSTYRYKNKSWKRYYAEKILKGNYGQSKESSKRQRKNNSINVIIKNITIADISISL